MSDSGGPAETAFGERVMYALLILIFAAVVGALCVEGYERFMRAAPPRDALVQVTGTAMSFKDNSKGDVYIRLREHSETFIYPAYATGWGELMGMFHANAKVTLLHEPANWPHREFRDGLAVYEIEIDDRLVVPYKFASRNWEFFNRIELLLIAGVIVGFAVFSWNFLRKNGVLSPSSDA